MNRTVLVVAAHPDDEILGVGGTIARHVAAGDEIHILIVGEGATSRPGEGRLSEVGALQEAARCAASALGARPPVFLGLPDNRLDSRPLLELVQQIEEMIEALAPETVYTHHGGDLNLDHQITHRAVITAARPLPGSSVRRIRLFETASSTEWATTAVGEVFKPECFVDISAHLAAKRQALQCYSSEMRPFPHARSFEALESLARLRGSQAGLLAAEGFRVALDIEG